MHSNCNTPTPSNSSETSPRQFRFNVLPINHETSMIRLEKNEPMTFACASNKQRNDAIFLVESLGNKAYPVTTDSLSWTTLNELVNTTPDDVANQVTKWNKEVLERADVVRQAFNSNIKDFLDNLTASIPEQYRKGESWNISIVFNEKTNSFKIRRK